MSIFQILKGLVTSKQFTRFLWTALDGFLGLLIVYFTNINIAWIIPIFAFIQGLTKEMMNKVSVKK